MDIPIKDIVEQKKPVEKKAVRRKVLTKEYAFLKNLERREALKKRLYKLKKSKDVYNFYVNLTAKKTYNGKRFKDRGTNIIFWTDAIKEHIDSGAIDVKPGKRLKIAPNPYVRNMKRFLLELEKKPKEIFKVEYKKPQEYKDPIIGSVLVREKGTDIKGIPFGIKLKTATIKFLDTLPTEDIVKKAKKAISEMDDKEVTIKSLRAKFDDLSKVDQPITKEEAMRLFPEQMVKDLKKIDEETKDLDDEEIKQNIIEWWNSLPASRKRLIYTNIGLITALGLSATFLAILATVIKNK